MADPFNTTASCAAMREAPKPPLSIQEAIDRAQRMREQPELIVSSGEAAETVEVLLQALEKSRCYFNAVRRGHEVFVLVEPDVAAPNGIDGWADQVEFLAHGPTVKSTDARATAARWRESATPKKVPD